jgi:hypothetical protein
MNSTTRETFFLFAAGIAAIVAVLGHDANLGDLFYAILHRLQG